MSKPELPSSDQIRQSGRVIPFLSEPEHSPTLRYYDRFSPARGRLEGLISEVFKRSYGAELRDFSDYLIGLEQGTELSGVVGVRLAADGPLFSEQYLDIPVETSIQQSAGQISTRSRIVEIGNLAVPGAGDARKLFAGLSAFLYAAGFEWVVFTAITPLTASFRRMGFEPQIIADAPLHRLTTSSTDWGSYYELKPQVCIGSVALGHQHMQAAISARQPSLSRFWSQSTQEGERFAQLPVNHSVGGYWA